MRYAWIAFLIIFLDQGIKWGMYAAGIGGVTLLDAPPVMLELLPSNLPSLEEIYAKLSNSTNLLLLLALITTHLLVSRWSIQSYFITRKTKVGMQFAGAGIISYIAENIFSGGVNSILRLDFSGFALNAGIADISLLLGFILLVLALIQGGSTICCNIPLLTSDIAPLRFSHMPRGVDNIHIDVLLSPEFCKLTSRIIHSLAPIVIRHQVQGKQSIALPSYFLDELTSQFNGLLNSALHLAKTRGDKQISNLFYIALQKHIHSEVTNTVATIIQRKKEKVQERNRRGVGSQNDIRLVEWMFRHRERIIVSTNLTLLNALDGERNSDADKAIESTLGKHHLFIQQARQTPLVKAESTSDEYLLMNHYALLGLHQDDPNSFLNIDKLLSDSFRDYVSLMRAEEVQEKADRHLVRDSDTLSQPSVMMNQHNITVLLDTDWTRQKLQHHKPWSDWRNYRKFRRHLDFQQRLIRKLSDSMHKTGLADWINANYETKELLEMRSTLVSPEALASLLASNVSHKEFKQNLREFLKSSDNAPSAQTISDARERIQKQREALLERNLLPFIRDFSRYRHDLAMLFTYQRAAGQLSLLNDEKDIRTSRANHILYEFLGSSERRCAEAPVLSHIIIKADLRGSTDITQKLTELDLNPATHFDRNFFSPINELIDTYGAEKVFIEGDAVILILNEREGDTEGRLVASHACGLAAKILQVVARQNEELSVYGLPQLELGIGIAYCDESPRYLFDQQHRITISPAINRADRLSSCAWGVRKWREQQHAPQTHVEVYQPSVNAMGQGEKAQKDLIYNLNGVLMEDTVFDKLLQEITPKPLQNTLSRYADSSLYSIEFPDRNGSYHQLLIRKAPVRIYDQDYRIEDCPIAESRFFYEVLHEKETLQQALSAAI